tara:strand:+ start:416 stop:652 length:237 start_codon:yes stop_codon:yes gene_type:complete
VYNRLKIYEINTPLLIKKNFQLNDLLFTKLKTAIIKINATGRPLILFGINGNVARKYNAYLIKSEDFNRFFFFQNFDR